MKTKLSFLIALMSLTLNAQTFTGKAIYKTSIKSNISFNKFNNDKNPTMSDDLKKQLQVRLQKMNQKTFILEFDKQTSVYKEDVKEDPTSQGDIAKVVVMSFGGSSAGEVYYKNLKENRYSNQTEIQGKRFLVKDKLPKNKWELSSETKNIGNYTCYKATYSKEVESNPNPIKDRESVEEEKKEIITTTAWYTSEVPISNGPKNYQGLPGLILEINDGKKIIVCTEIILNPSDKVTIKEPKKGKVVSQQKFDEIKKEKTKEMLERFRSRKGVNIGNGIEIKFGG